jgi:recombination protein RecA
MATDAKAKALEAALAHIEKTIGKGSVMKLGQQAHADGVDVISTGSLTLDVALGIGGLPRG